MLHPVATSFLQRSIEIAQLAGLHLLILDAYRPQQAQWHLLDVCPDANYDVPPAQGTNHRRGVAIDLMLLDEEGRELDMGTAFDAMESQSYPFHLDVAQPAQRHRLMLNAIYAGRRVRWNADRVVAF